MYNITRIQDIYRRVIGEAYYIVNNKATVRETAEVFKISKSTVHTDVTKKLYKYDWLLAIKVKKVLAENKSQRHLRGGEATRRKYSKGKEQE